MTNAQQERLSFGGVERMKIGIVNDLYSSLAALNCIVKTQKDYEVIWNARNGQEAVEKCVSHTPDLVLMDLVMPVMDGVEATRLIMHHSPCAILIVTASVNGHSSLVFEAMSYGALDVLKTPSLDMEKPDLGGAALLKKMKMIRWLIKKEDLQKALTFNVTPKKMAHAIPPLVVIGSSTGGPKALAKIVSHFPVSPAFATVIVQHVDEQFAPILAKWLALQTSHYIKIAEDGMALMPGDVILAGRNEHLILKESQTLHYTEEPRDYLCRPSIDAFFFSAARFWPVKSVGVLLTGMGNDGAIGLKMLKEAGWTTIVQSGETCIVNGMPKAAVEIGAATSILPLDRIGPMLMEFFSTHFGTKK